MSRLHRKYRTSLILVFALNLASCSKMPSPTKCEDPDLDCYSNNALNFVVGIKHSIVFWSNINSIAIVAIALLSIIATVMLALQGDENKHWTKPIGIVATALVTGLTSAIASFHVTDTVDKLITVAGEMTDIANKFSSRRETLVAGRGDDQVKEAFKSDAKFREQVNDLTTQFANEWSKETVKLLEIYGTSAKLSSPSHDATTPKS